MRDEKIASGSAANIVLLHCLVCMLYVCAVCLKGDRDRPSLCLPNHNAYNTHTPRDRERHAMNIR